MAKPPERKEPELPNLPQRAAGITPAASVGAPLTAGE